MCDNNTNTQRIGFYFISKNKQQHIFSLLDSKLNPKLTIKYFCEIKNRRRRRKKRSNLFDLFHSYCPINHPKEDKINFEQTI